MVPGKSICCNCDGGCGIRLRLVCPSPSTTTCRLGSLSLLARKSIYIVFSYYFAAEYTTFASTGEQELQLKLPRTKTESRTRSKSNYFQNNKLMYIPKGRGKCQCPVWQRAGNSSFTQSRSLHSLTHTHTHTYAFVLSTVDRLRGEYSYVKLWRQRRLRSTASLRASQTLAHFISMLLSWPTLLRRGKSVRTLWTLFSRPKHFRVQHYQLFVFQICWLSQR